MEPASVAVAIICKDGSKTLGTCLDSIRPWVKQIVVCVDERTTDETADIAREHGADIVTTVRVSDWHECARHGKVLAQHFANARNESFKHLDPSIEWWGWIDADDVFTGGEHLAKTLATVPEIVNCIWLAYHYATLNGGKAITTTFDRERLLRSREVWRWNGRVHETVGLVKVPIAPMRFTHMAVQHQEGVHKSESSTLRNELLLEIDLEENPTDVRATFYMANGKFAQQKWVDAINWYGRLIQMKGANDWERWQSFCYSSIAYRQLGDLDHAMQAAFRAIDIHPSIKDPYHLMAAISLMAGEFDKAIYWTGQADQKEEPPYFVFKNPLDYTANAYMVLADAYFQKLMPHEALKWYRMAYRQVANPGIKMAIESCEKMIAAMKVAQAFVEIVPVIDDKTKITLFGLLPLDVRAFGRVRDIVIPILMAKRAA